MHWQGWANQGEASGLIGLRSIAGFLWLVLNQIQVRDGNKNWETVIDQALTILGQLLQRFWFGLLELLLMWFRILLSGKKKRILLSYVVWPLSVCLFSLSVPPLGEPFTCEKARDPDCHHFWIVAFSPWSRSHVLWDLLNLFIIVASWQ